MAASARSESELYALSEFGVADIDPILHEEVAVWRRELDWDFQSSADLVRRFVSVKALSGYVLVHDGSPAGYVYYVCEDRKGLVGDLYVLEQVRIPSLTHRLLSAAVEAMMRTGQIRRIESQLMLLNPDIRGPFPQFLQVQTRDFMSVGIARVARLPARSLGPDLSFERWTDPRQQEAAQLIANAYRGHIDSEINDQYRSLSGASRFLFNIVQYPGCGTFCAPASWTAISRSTGRLCGICLASLISSESGHITQVCVAPSLRGKGLGYELVRHSLASLAQAHCKHASLTVTTANIEAHRLYAAMGFQTVRQFPAMVWQGF